jgi:hypothetical protein
MKRKDSGQKPNMPGTMIDTRGISLSAGVAAFDAVLVKRFRDAAAKAPMVAEQIQSEAFGEAGPAPVQPRLPQPFRRGDDEA